jgi:hypothetical protein
MPIINKAAPAKTERLFVFPGGVTNNIRIWNGF